MIINNGSKAVGISPANINSVNGNEILPAQQNVKPDEGSKLLPNTYPKIYFLGNIAKETVPAQNIAPEKLFQSPEGKAQLAKYESDPKLLDNLIEKSTPEKAFGVLESLFSTDSDWEEQRKEVLKISDEKSRKETLAELAKDPVSPLSTSSIRKHAIELIGKIKIESESDFKLRDELIDKLSTKSPLHKAQLAGYLSDSKRAYKILEEICKNGDASFIERQEAAQSAVNIKNPKLRDKLMLKISGLSLIDALSVFKDGNKTCCDEFTIEGLALSLKKAPDSKLRDKFIAELARKFSDASGLLGGLSNSKRAVRIIKEICYDPKSGPTTSLRDPVTNEKIRRTAAGSAWMIKDPALRDSLIEELSKNSDWVVREGAASSAWNISDPKLRDAVLDKLSNDTEERVISKPSDKILSSNTEENSSKGTVEDSSESINEKSQNLEVINGNSDTIETLPNNEVRKAAELSKSKIAAAQDKKVD
jgi:HEAT repeat protein